MSDLTEGCHLLHAHLSSPCALCKQHKAYALPYHPTGWILLQSCKHINGPASGVSCYQCTARRHGSCLDSAPHVPLRPSQFTWSESNHYSLLHVLPARVYFGLCLYCFSYKKKGLCLHCQASGVSVNGMTSPILSLVSIRTKQQQ